MFTLSSTFPRRNQNSLLCFITDSKQLKQIEDLNFKWSQYSRPLLDLTKDTVLANEQWELFQLMVLNPWTHSFISHNASLQWLTSIATINSLFLALKISWFFSTQWISEFLHCYMFLCWQINRLKVKFL